MSLAWCGVIVWRGLAFGIPLGVYCVEAVCGHAALCGMLLGVVSLSSNRVLLRGSGFTTEAQRHGVSFEWTPWPPCSPRHMSFVYRLRPSHCSKGRGFARPVSTAKWGGHTESDPGGERAWARRAQSPYITRAHPICKRARVSRRGKECGILERISQRMRGGMRAPEC